MTAVRIIALGPKAESSSLDFRSHEPWDTTREESRMEREAIPGLEVRRADRIGRFWTIKPLPVRLRSRLRALLSYLNDERLDKVIVPIISKQSRLSLRTLDWLVINYAKRFSLTLVSQEHQKLINVYTEYRNALRFWQRDLFDAFRRTARVFFDFNGVTYSSTVAQLNYLHWCETNSILHYVDRNLAKIERDMTLRIAHCRQKKGTTEGGTKRKRCELSQHPTIKCHVINLPVELDFK